MRPRWAVLGAALVAGAPVVWGTVRAVADHWTPYGDRAVIAVRSFDVLTVHSPAVGQYTQWSQVLGRPVFSPGPMLYWLLAVPAHLLGATALPIWIAAVNLACLAGILLLARRRGGPALMAATAIALPLMFRSLPSETFHDIWNPSAALLPFLLACLLVWSVAVGEHRLAPAAVLAVSFIVQTHSTYALPVVGLVVVAAAGLIADRAARPAERRHRARWLWAAVLVGVACWAAPLGDQLTGSGNLGALLDAARAAQGHLGTAAGWHAVVHAFGIPPWWLGPDIGDGSRLTDVLHSPGWGSQLACALLLAGLVGALAVGVARRRVETAAPAAITLVLALALGIGTASTPTQGNLYLTAGYTLWWASPAGLFAWLCAGRLGARELVRLHAAERVARRLRGGALALPVAAGLVVLAVALVVAVRQPGDRDRGDFRPFAAAAGALSAALPRPGSVYMAADPAFPSSELEYELVYALRRLGATVHVQPAAAAELGTSYRARRPRGSARVRVGYGNAVAPGASVIVRVRVGLPSFTPGLFTVVGSAVDHRAGETSASARRSASR